MEDVLFETERRQTRAEMADLLRSVADRLEDDGEVTLSAGGDSVTLAVPPEATLEVKAERETEGSETELSVEFEIEWNPDDGGRSGALDVS